ncbi:hypothetical protein GCM10022419_054390 [Nonomuraea rosea]|uniref:Carrier domain-containing protein n=1 Tax=Nonomuraea rosea TaxID=638574 RepID=A0ABP6XHH9_9ACTN
MTTIDDFIALVQDEIGIPVTVADAERGFDELDHWDSVHLLALLIALERATGQRVSMPDVMEATSLQDIFELAVPR